MVSLYKHIKEVTNGHEVALLLILQGIKQGQWQTAVEQIRTLEDKKARTEAKKTIPYFTPSGTFSHRSIPGLKTHSGILAIDIDHDTSKRRQLEQDPYTYALHLSVSGDGLVVYVKIDPLRHLDSFKWIEKYYRETYEVLIDKSCKNVDRARFISYDPDLFHNPDSKTLGPDELNELDLRPKPSAPPVVYGRTNYGQVILERAVNLVLKAEDGEKHKQLNTAGFLLGGYVATGFLFQSEAEEALKNAIRQKSNVASYEDADKVISRSIREGMAEPILPDEVEMYVRTQRRDGQYPDNVLTKVSAMNGVPENLLRPVVEKIYQEPNVKIEKFWRLVLKDEKKEQYKLEMSKSKYLAFLEEAGFGTYKVGKNHLVVQVKNNIVRAVDRKEIKQYVISYVASLPFEFDGIFRFELDERLKSEHRIWFEEGLIEMLPDIGNEFQRDTRTHAYFYFNNGFLTITRHTVIFSDYKLLAGKIWLEQVIDRKFTLIEETDYLNDTDFYRFLFNITGQEIKPIGDNTPGRLCSLMTAIGYLLHGYKAPSNPKVVILVDEQISDVPSGGTGKGLVFQAIKRMQPTEVLDGKTFDFKDKFAMQTVNETTRLIVFEDWDGKRLPFDKLFNMTTNELKINRLYLGQVSVPYERSPKFAITTNDMVSGEGDSHARRKFEIEIAPHYSAQYTPVDEFGLEFFNDWEAEEWNRFDNLMINCVQLFLTGGLKFTAPININRRKLLQETSDSFVEFCDALDRNYTYYKKDIYDSFLLESGNNESRFTFDRFKKWLTKYFKYMELEVEQDKNRTPGPLKNQTYFTIKSHTNGKDNTGNAH